MFIIANVERTVGDDHGVASAEALLDILGEVKPLLNKHHGVGAGLLCHFHKFHNVSGVAGGAFLHLLVVISEMSGRVFGSDSESGF